jgi:hypothetical protein
MKNKNIFIKNNQQYNQYADIYHHSRDEKKKKKIVNLIVRLFDICI